MEDIFARLKLSKCEDLPNTVLMFIEKISYNHYIHYIDKYKSENLPGYFVEVSIKVNIPSKGVYHSLNIKNEEKLLINFHEKFPHYAPAVMICRTDFPFEYIPHLNYGIRKSDIEELNLCLYRGNINERYQNHGANDFLNLIVRWFEDLVNGKLIKDDGFETIRYTGDLHGCIIANYESIVDIIEKGELLRGYKIFAASINNPEARIVHIIGQEFIYDKPNKIPCVLLGNNSTVDDIYISKPISKISDLKDFNSYRYLNHALKKLRGSFYDPKDCKFEYGIVILMAIKRGQQVIGEYSNYEMIGMKVFLDWASMDIENAKAELLIPIKELSSKIAAKLSGVEKSQDKILIIGCGAVGSKVSLNLAKMGHINQILIDDDSFLPHNAVRHENIPFLYQGYNKARYIADTIKFMYGSEADVDYQTESGYEIDFSKYHDCNIIDCTASQNFMFYSIENSDIKNPLMRCELVDAGRLGLNFIEGSNRNPNVSEMRSMLWYTALKNEVIMTWLTNAESNEADQEIRIGYGCSSDTMVLDNATISYHSSIIPHFYLKNFGHNSGKISISYFDKADLENNKIEILDVNRFFRFKLEKGINVSVSDIALSKAIETVSDSKENAGIWLGGYNDILNEIVIVDTFISREHIRRTAEIMCGYEDVNDYIKLVMKKTNGLIGYVGEWHTHPNGVARPSAKDLVAFNEVRKSFSVNHEPLLMSIFANKTQYHELLV